MSKNPIDLGLYTPNDSGQLTCTVEWNADLDAFTYGGRVVSDADGIHIEEAEGVTGTEEIEGEVEFRWIFYAAIDDDYVPPKTGLFDNENVTYCLILGVLLVLIVVLIVLIVKRKRRHS